MKTRSIAIAIVLLASIGPASPLAAQSLRGSRASLDRQNSQAQAHDYTYLDARSDVRRFVGAGILVPLTGGAHYKLNGVSYEVARPEVRLFVERLSAQYHRACGMPLVVTSLTRPKDAQPSNASRRSVHPTGMALDLRVPAQSRCRTWLESTLLELERGGVLDATLERNPRHYHVALFPEAYTAYVARQTGRPVPGSSAGREVASVSARRAAHTVRRGETLWRIAQAYDTTPLAIRRANGLSSSNIKAGQRLVIPTRDVTAGD
jgi:hypothetical protein